MKLVESMTNLKKSTIAACEAMGHKMDSFHATLIGDDYSSHMASSRCSVCGARIEIDCWRLEVQGTALVKECKDY